MVYINETVICAFAHRGLYKSHVLPDKLEINHGLGDVDVKIQSVSSVVREMFKH